VRLSVLLTVLSIFPYCFGQRYNFVNYSLEEGLPQSQVSDICQDRFGYLWLGTETGLSRFDGIRFVNFSTDDGLPDNEIDKLFLDKNNKLWVATPKGLARLDVDHFTAFPFSADLLLEYNVNDLCEFRSEVYLATDEGLLRFEKDTFLLLTGGNESALTMRTICSSGDSVLVCGTKNGLFRYAGTDYVRLGVPAIDTLNISDLFFRGDELIVSTYGDGVLAYNLRTQSDSIFALDAGSNRIRSIYANQQSILCATKNGAVEITPSGTYYYSLANGLIFENIRCVFIDREGNLWLGTNGKGLLKLMGKSILSYTKSDGLSSDAVMGISQDKNGYYYFGTYDAGVTKWKENKDSASSVIINQELKNSTVWVTAIDHENRCWVGSSSGLDAIEGNRVFNDPVLEQIQSKIRSVLFLSDSVKLVGGSDGVFWLTGSGLTPLFRDHALDVNKMGLIGNRLYIAATTGLYSAELTKGGSAVVRIDLPENNVKSLTVDQSGNLWIGTNSSGIFIRTPSGDLFPFSLDNMDSKSKTVLGLITDSYGNIWVSTLNGVYQVSQRPESKNRFLVNHYGRAEGLITLECNQNALFEDADHYIWVGTSEGLAKINPSLNDELFSFNTPQLLITGVRLFMEEFDYGNYPVEMDSLTGVPLSITLPYNKNHLTFDFIGINLKDPEGVRYEYRLLGAEENWSPLSATSYATYSFIDNGEYNFEVRATNNSGDWSSTQSIRIIILPPFWLTWWFILILVFAGFLILVIIFQVRIRAIKQKQENEKLGYKNRLLFLEQQSLNASMNRHFIFNSLNSIQYFINSSNKLAANKYLTSFAKLIRKNLDSSTANNFIVTLKEEIERIELYLSLEKMRFEGKFDYILDIEDDIDTDNIEIPSMILQPFVENSIIHGVLPLDRKGEIKILIYNEFGYIVFEVLDDGVGIDNSLAKKTTRRDDEHESMGMDITSRRIELIRKLTGENLMIVGPFQQNSPSGECLGTRVIIKIHVESEEIG
jgi:ligand-binding sensor domain-containing protein